MRCKNTARLLNIYADNELPEQTQLAVKEHLTGCQGCTQTLKEIIKLKEIIGTATPYPANPFLWTRIAAGIREKIPMPIGILVPKILRVWIPIATVLILLSGFVLFNLPKPESTVYKGTLSTILDMPISPENMEKITLNLLVYSNGLAKEAPYVKF